MFEELDARNAEMMMKTSEELHPYIFVCANIQTHGEGGRTILDSLVDHGYSMMRWRFE